MVKSDRLKSAIAASTIYNRELDHRLSLTGMVDAALFADFASVQDDPNASSVSWLQAKLRVLSARVSSGASLSLHDPAHGNLVVVNTTEQFVAWCDRHFPVINSAAVKRRPSAMRIEVDDLSRPAVHDLLREHLTNMYELSPADKVFALDLSRLKAPEITFWTVWEGQTLLGCGALKELSAKHGEVKSMRTPANARRTGAGRAVLETIIRTARERGYERLSLETGSHHAFAVAQQLYLSSGFQYSGPFADYKEDPNSVFMSMRLDDGAA